MASRMDNSSRRTVVVRLVLVHLLAMVICCAIAVNEGAENEIFCGMLHGMVFAQSSLLAAWLALGPQPFFQRCPLVLLLLVVSVTLVYAEFAIEDPYDRLSVLVETAVMVFVQCWAVQVPLWLIRLVFGWQLGTLDSSVAYSEREELQFGIKQLFGWTAAVALSVGHRTLVDGRRAGRKRRGHAVDRHSHTGTGGIQCCGGVAHNLGGVSQSLDARLDARGDCHRPGGTRAILPPDFGERR